jgi:bacillithiol biosynthesis cysteine-adding enzyme BshC
VKIEKYLIHKERQRYSASFYPYNPTQAESYQQRYNYVCQQQYKREELVAVLRDYHQPELMHPAVQRNLERLLLPDSVVVIGGQQAGMLTGPLYTLYKVVTIIQLARREEERLQKPVIPVFWIAGEDHDQREVDHIYVPVDLKMEKHVFPLTSMNKASVSSLMLEPTVVKQWLNDLHQAIADREHKPEWVTLCEELTEKPISWTRFFARLLHYLFAAHGLLLIDANDPNLRKLETGYFQQMIGQNEALAAAVDRGISHWEEAGNPSVLQFEAGQAHLFMEQDGQRVALFRENEKFISRNRFYQYTAEELMASVEKLSNNVATRPLMQEMVFPVLAFVGGPSEIAYWGCLTEAFTTFGLQMPIVYPRQSVTLVERSIEKYQQEWGVAWEELLVGNGQLLLDSWKEENRPIDITAKFAELQTKLSEIYQPFVNELTKEIGGNIQQLGESTAKKLTADLAWLEQKSIATIDTQQETQLRHRRAVVQAIYPRNGLQERSYNLIYFWNSYGLDWLDMLCKQKLPEIDSHQLLFL